MKPAPDFNRLARVYRWLEYLSFGPWLWHCRIYFLPQLKDCQRALVLGDGDGRFTARLLQENRQIEVLALDASPRMIESLEKAVGPDRDRLSTAVADLRTWRPTESKKYDLIVSHFFLDCLRTEEITMLADRLAPAMTGGARWVVSEFAIPQTLFGRLLATPLVALLYRAFRLLTQLDQQSLPDYPRALSAADWTLQDEQHHLGGLLVSQIWKFEPSLN